MCDSETTVVHPSSTAVVALEKWMEVNYGPDHFDPQAAAEVVARYTPKVLVVPEPLRKMIVEADSLLSLVGYRYAGGIPGDVATKMRDLSWALRQFEEARHDRSE